MKKIVASAFVLLLAAIFLFGFSSCGKEESTPPTLTFATGSSYIAKDTALVHGTVFNIGIQATKTGTEGMLTTCQIARSINNGPDSTIHQMNFFTQSFTQYYSYPAPDSGNIERYTFTVGKLDGLTNSVSVAITGI